MPWVGLILVPQVILCPIWLRYFPFGPLEWLWRSLTYGQAQPMKRHRQKSAAL
jgi:uncharacterized protein